jgi:tetratricopeptide (TPR) repeat protein
MRDNARLRNLVLVLSGILILMVVGLGIYANRVNMFRQIAETAGEESRYADQANTLTEWARLEPWKKELPGMAAAAFFQAGDFNNASAWYSKAKAISTLSQSEKLRYGQALMEIEKTEEARSVFENIDLQSDLTLSEVQTLSKEWRILGNPEAALSVLETWQTKENIPDVEMGWNTSVLTAVLHPQSALPAIISITSDKPQLREKLIPLITILSSTNVKKAEYWIEAGRFLFENREWDLAEIAFKQATRLNPTDPESWAFLGQSKLTQMKDGYPDLVKAIELNNRSRLGRYFLAMYWRERGQISVARNYLDSLSAEEPREPLWQLELGKTAYAVGDTSGALQFFQSAAEMDADNPASWQALGEFCLVNGIDLAGTGETAVQQALLLAPDDPISNDLMGWLLLSRGDPDNALRFLKKSVSGKATDARNRLHLAQAWWGVGEKESARQELLAALELDPNGPVGLTAGRLLRQYFPAE